MPSDWYDVFRTSRVKPMPFEVVEVEQNLMRSWTAFLEKYYKKEVRACKVHPQFIIHRSSYNGVHESTVMVIPNIKNIVKKEKSQLKPGEFMYPPVSYNGK